MRGDVSIPSTLKHRSPHHARSSLSRATAVLGCFTTASLLAGCAGFPDTAPQTTVILENRYAPSTSLVVYDAHWLNISFQGQAVAPGASSIPQPVLAGAASAENTAYVALAPGWDPTSAVAPTRFVFLQSRGGLGVALGDTLHIGVDDATFDGNCAAGHPLTQAQADFLTQIVFPSDFAGYGYDAATCTTAPIGDAGGT